jgi:ABC-type transporter Mla MlaB component
VLETTLSVSLDGTLGSDVGVATIRDAGTVWIDVCGEADIATSEQLSGYLAGIELAGAQVHLMLSQLVFCDLHGLRVLSAFVREARVRAERLTVHELPPSLWRLLRLVGPEIG